MDNRAAQCVVDLSGLSASKSLRFVPSENSDRGLLYDSRRGQGVIVSRAVWKLLQCVQRGEDVTPLFDRLPDPEQLLQPLFEHGHLSYLGSPPARPQVLTRELTSGYLVQDLRLTIIESCNFGCSYCYANTTSGRVMSWETARTAIDRFVEIQRTHRRNRAKLKFFGGEPLMAWPLVRQILEYLDSPELADIRFTKSMNTNATLLDQAKREILVHHGVKLQVSLDGLPEVNDRHRIFHSHRGTAQVVVDRLREILAAGMDLDIIAVLAEDVHLERLPEFIDFLDRLRPDRSRTINLGANFVKCAPRHYTLTPTERAGRIAAANILARSKNIHLSGFWLYPFLRVFGEAPTRFCPGIGGEMNVAPDGSIFPCNCGTTQLGHISNVPAMLQSENYQKTATRVVGTILECSGCDIEGPCAGNCAADAQFQTGNWDRHHDECDFDRAVFRELARSYVDGRWTL
jgi:uncharacterized protein